MSAIFDRASSMLLCDEDNDSVLGIEEGEERGGERSSRASEPKRCDFYGDFVAGVPVQSMESLGLLMKREHEHLPREDYLERLRSGDADFSIRRDAIHWMRKVHAQYNFGPLSAYLSVNYLDRFLSSYELPKGKAWMGQLLAVACLSLAAKMEETEAPLTMDLQVCESRSVFEARTIKRMELLVLSTLGWRMQAITPFSYIDFFLHKVSGGQEPIKWMLTQSAQLILDTVRGTDFLMFRPSEVAAAIALLVVGENQAVDAEKNLSSCGNVAKERILECYEVIQEVNSSASSMTLSPVGVLDAACLSYKCDDSAAEPHGTCAHASSASKRRRLSQ